MSKFIDWIKDHGATILSWAATAGTIAGPVVTVKTAKKAEFRRLAALDKKRQEAFEQMAAKLDSPIDSIEYKMLMEKAQDVDLTWWEKMKAVLPSYLPVIFIEAGTIGCIHGSNVLNKHEIKKGQMEIQKLTQSLSAATATFAAYKGCVEALDPVTERGAEKMAAERAKDEANGVPWTEVRTFYIDGQPEFFERTMEQVWKAELEVNRLLAVRGWVTLNEFYTLLGLPEVPDGDEKGWDQCVGYEYYGYSWVDFAHEDYFTQSEMRVTEIRMVVDPHPLDEAEADAEINEAIRPMGIEVDED